MVILERDLLLQRMVCYFGPYDRVAVPVVSVSAHWHWFSREAVLQVMLAAAIVQENGFVYTVFKKKKKVPVIVTGEKKKKNK